MEVTRIDSGAVQLFEELMGKRAPSEVREKELTAPVEKKQAPKEAPYTSWQKSILLDALDDLEKKRRPDNSHPLSAPENSPIETYEEALIELSYVKSDKFKEEAAGAQANINAGDVLSLFMDEPNFARL